ncbi:cupin domain-containing protein [Bradyrhizobium sp. STM 3562]|uniref:cupin domain-containing protein n=1 Tax=Bradyrhizobium sp. STM 3562 TaxID=578924 RepID=UPI00388D7EFE
MRSSLPVAMRFAKAAIIIMSLSTPAKTAPRTDGDIALTGVIVPAPATSSPIRRGSAQTADATVNVATLPSAISSASGAAVHSAITVAALSERPSESVKPVFERPIPNLPDRKLIAVLVNYPPAGRSRSHYHAKSAFIYAYVLSGAIRSAVGAEPARTYRAGESFYEDPGAHHLVSENASDTEPASLLAVFIVEAGDQPLTTPDAQTGN